MTDKQILSMIETLSLRPEANPWTKEMVQSVALSVAHEERERCAEIARKVWFDLDLASRQTCWAGDAQRALEDRARIVKGIEEEIRNSSDKGIAK